MPITKTRAGRSMQWTPASNRESFPSPSPLYSGHLLKLGSNDRWQSRLFTFDGSGNLEQTMISPCQWPMQLNIANFFFFFFARVRDFLYSNSTKLCGPSTKDTYDLNLQPSYLIALRFKSPTAPTTASPKPKHEVVNQHGHSGGHPTLVPLENLSMLPKLG